MFFINTFVWYILEWFSMCAYSYIRAKIDFPSKSSSTVPKVLFSYLLVFMHLTDLVSIGINVFQQISNMKNTPSRILPIRRKTLDIQSINQSILPCFSAAFSTYTNVCTTCNKYVLFHLFFPVKRVPDSYRFGESLVDKVAALLRFKMRPTKSPQVRMPSLRFGWRFSEDVFKYFFFCWLLTNF